MFLVDESEASLFKVRIILRELQVRFMEQSEERQVKEWLTKIEALLSKARELPKTIIAVAGKYDMCIHDRHVHVHVQYMFEYMCLKKTA